MPVQCTCDKSAVRSYVRNTCVCVWLYSFFRLLSVRRYGRQSKCILLTLVQSHDLFIHPYVRQKLFVVTRCEMWRWRNNNIFNYIMCTSTLTHWPVRAHPFDTRYPHLYQRNIIRVYVMWVCVQPLIALAAFHYLLLNSINQKQTIKFFNSRYAQSNFSLALWVRMQGQVQMGINFIYVLRIEPRVILPIKNRKSVLNAAAIDTASTLMCMRWADRVRQPYGQQTN